MQNSLCRRATLKTVTRRAPRELFFVILDGFCTLNFRERIKELHSFPNDVKALDYLKQIIILCRTVCLAPPCLQILIVTTKVWFVFGIEIWLWLEPSSATLPCKYLVREVEPMQVPPDKKSLRKQSPRQIVCVQFWKHFTAPNLQSLNPPTEPRNPETPKVDFKLRKMPFWPPSEKWPEKSIKMSKKPVFGN